MNDFEIMEIMFSHHWPFSEQEVNFFNSKATQRELSNHKEVPVLSTEEVVFINKPLFDETLSPEEFALKMGNLSTLKRK